MNFSFQFYLFVGRYKQNWKDGRQNKKCVSFTLYIFNSSKESFLILCRSQGQSGYLTYHMIKLSKMKILIVDNDSKTRRVIGHILRGSYVLVEEVSSFAEALEKVTLYDYDCVIEEINLPDGDGLDLINVLKQKNTNSCVIIVSVLGSVKDKIRGLNFGADDYMTKPFDLAELNARINSVLRRRKFAGRHDVVFHELKIDTEAHLVFVGDISIRLTPKEYSLLLYFIMNKNRVLTRISIVEDLWGDMVGITADSLDFLNTHIRNLRYKIKKAGGTDYIQTVYSVGYKFADL